jgi:hypothetical protein
VRNVPSVMTMTNFCSLATFFPHGDMNKLIFYAATFGVVGLWERKAEEMLSGVKERSFIDA